VEGLFRVDPALLGGAACDYTAELEIKDSRGQSLKQDKWDGTCPVANGSALPALEVFRFGMPDGETFTVIVSVNSKDRPKEKHSRTITVKSLPSRSATSDLVLARQVGLIDSATASQWTIKRGSVGIRAASETVVEPSAPTLAYYVELYPGKNQVFSGTAWGVVRTREGVELSRFQLQKLDSVVTFRPVAGKASLAGLAPGAYTFEVQLALADTTISLRHPFEMMAEVVATTGGAPATGFFATVSDADMEGKFGSATVWLTQKAQSEVFKNLTPSGKREYLNRLFGPEMPTPNDGKESNIDAFVTRSEAVARRFSERAGRGTQDGWRTPRGKIYMLYGEPSALISRPAPRGGYPYEIFHYQTGKGLAFVFVDERRSRDYRLMWTNDPAQQGVANGVRNVSVEAQEDLQRLGVRIVDQ
ncbi:MAG: GWxTD domain-containing protein, partial [Longimicrobiales bacterium]